MAPGDAAAEIVDDGREHRRAGSISSPSISPAEPVARPVVAAIARRRPPLQLDGGLGFEGNGLPHAEEGADRVEQSAHAGRGDAEEVALELAGEDGHLGIAGAARTGSRSGVQSIPAAHKWLNAARYGLRTVASPPGSGTYLR